MKVLNLTKPAVGLGTTFRRYLSPIVNSPHKVSLKKYANAAHAELERRLRRSTLKSSPFILHFEVTNSCNLQCPKCPTGRGENTISKGFLTLGDYQKVIDQLQDTLVLARLDGMGESFLNPEMPDIIEYTARKNIVSAVSTNFTLFKNPDDLKKLFEAGLDYLIISFDGATKDIYEQYKVGASYNEVLENIRELIQLKKRLKSKTPFIEMQFVAFDGNRHQLDKIHNLAASLDVDRLLVKGKVRKTIRTNNIQTTKGDPCYWLWYVLNVGWNGELKACCFDGLTSSFSFGNILTKPVTEVWNNEVLREVRSLFNRNNKIEQSILTDCICLKCYKVPSES